MKGLLLWALVWMAVISGVQAQSVTLDQSTFCRTADGPEVTVTGTIVPASGSLRVFDGSGQDITDLLAIQLRLAKNPLTGAFYAILDGPTAFALLPATYTIVTDGADASVSIYFVGAEIIGPLSLSACDVATELQLSGFSPGDGTFTGNGVTGNMFDPVAAGAGAHEVTYSGTYQTCNYTTTVTIVVEAPQEQDYISGVASAYCVGAEVTGVVSRLDGTLTNNGGGVPFDGTTGAFSISGLLPGNYELVYAIPGGCSETILYTVSNPNTVDFQFVVPPNICQGAADVALSVLVSIDGGPFSPTIDGEFSDDAATIDTLNGVYILNTARDPGVYNAIYTFRSAGCEYTTPFSYEVKGISTPMVTGFNATHFTCESGAVTVKSNPVLSPFTFKSPTGADVLAPAFINLGDSAVFFPSLLAPGEYTLAVSDTAGGQCYEFSTTINILVSQTPNFGPMPTIYAGCDAVIPVEPVGGVLSYVYNGVETVLSGYVLNVSPGEQYVLKYNYGCGNVVQQIVDVLGANISGLNSAYYSSVSAVTMTGFPAGGTFSGPGVSGNVFSPNAAGPGTHVITYTFVTPGGCTMTAQRIVEVISIACNAPSGVAAGSITQTGATITWNPIAPTPLLYQLRYKKVGATLENFVNLSGTTTSFTLTGLEPGTTYQVRVRARCVNGIFSPFSVLTFFTTQSSGGCVAPTAATAVGFANGTAQISWTAAGAPADQTFEVEITYPDGNGIIVTTTGTSTSVSGLAPGDYTVVVYAICDPAGIATATFTIPVPPACQPVTELTATLAGTLNVSFTAPTGGAPVVAYEVSIDGTGIVQISGLTSVSLNVSTLVGGEYVVRVRTICEGGLFAEATTTFTKPAVDCSAVPFIRSISISSTSATIRWARLPNALEYEVQYRLFGATTYSSLFVAQTDASIQSALIPGLTPSTGYTVRVRALCAEGQISAFSTERRFTTLGGTLREGVEIDFSEPVAQWTVYPNPSKGMTTLSFVSAQAGPATVSVYNLLGTRVYDKTISVVQGENEFVLDLTGKAAGIYFAKFVKDEVAQTIRLVLE